MLLAPLQQPTVLDPEAPTKKARGQKQREHRDRLIASGGRYLSLELSSAAVAALQAIMAVQGLDSACAAVEWSLENGAKQVIEEREWREGRDRRRA